MRSKSPIDLKKFPVETFHYKGYFVYAIPSSFGNYAHPEKDQLVYIPACEGCAHPNLAEAYMDYEKSKDEHSISDEKISSIKTNIEEIFRKIGEVLSGLLGVEKSEFVPDVIGLPQVQKNRVNTAAVWELRTWPPCTNKIEAWHYAMTMVDLFIAQQSSAEEKTRQS